MPWFDINWARKTKITLPAASSVLTDFVSPLKLDITYTGAKSDGSDVIFVNAAEDTQLESESEL